MSGFDDMNNKTSAARTSPASFRPASYAHYGAFESTKIHGAGEDILGTTRHTEQWRGDLEMLRRANLLDLRYSAPWHRIEREPGVFDFSWMDGPMRFMERADMRPVIDLVHHTSFPDWLKDGFANPEFPSLYVRYVTEFARRYGWATRYTLFNEPLPTVLFCSLTGMWYPHRRTDRDFVRMAVNVGRAICLGAAAIRRLNPAAEFVHIDTCESHAPLDSQAAAWVRFANHRRFLMHDLVLGRIGAMHPLLAYLERHGFTRDAMHWFSDHRTRFDVLGLDYYAHSEMEWFTDNKGSPRISWPPSNPRGFANAARDYVQYFRTPVMLGETNLRGTLCDRLTWLRFMEEQCESLARTAGLRGFCWYPSIDSTDWRNCCTRCTRSVDPQGIWWLDGERRERHESELSDCYAGLASSKIGWRDLPAYEFTPPLDKDLRGYIKLMRHWSEWRVPAAA